MIPRSGRSPGGGHDSTPMLLPGESHGQRSLLGYSPWGIKVSIILSHFTAEDRTWKGSANCSSLQSWWMAELWFQTQLYNSREPPIPSPFQFSSVTQSCVTLCDPWTAACQASLSITNSQSLLKLMSIKSVMPSNHLILCHRFLLLPSIFQRVSSSHQVAKVLESQFQHQFFQQIFRTDLL